MRFATLNNTEDPRPRLVAVLGGGERIDLRDVPGVTVDTPAALAEHTNDVIDAVRRFVQSSHVHNPALDAMTFLPPVPRPSTFRDFYAFEQHVKACRARRGLKVPAAWYDEPAFYFSNPTSLIGNGTALFAPADSQELDFELELGVIIGKGGSNIRAEEAWNHIAGFTIINDFSARDIQRNEMAVGLGPAKGKDFATAVGPYLVPLGQLRDRIDSRDRVHLKMRAWMNGRQLCTADAASMYFTWPQIIERASRDAELLPGDLIGSGTVGGGCILELGSETTGGWLQPGDVIELDIERLGILRTPIVARPEPVLDCEVEEELVEDGHV